MANSFVIARQYGQNQTPGLRLVKLDATVSVGIGNMIVEVAGYGQIPAAATTYRIPAARLNQTTRGTKAPANSRELP